MKTVNLLSGLFVVIAIATGVSMSFAAENTSLTDMPPEMLIKDPAQSSILLAAMPEARKQKPKVKDPGAGSGLQSCMDVKYSSYYLWLKDGKRGEELPILAPITQACDSCLDRNAEAGRGWGQVRFNCASECCQ